MRSVFHRQWNGDVFETKGTTKYWVARLLLKAWYLKFFHKLNAPCLHDVLYDVKVANLEQPMRRTMNYGLRTFSYIGSSLCNLLIQEYPEVLHMDLG